MSRSARSSIRAEAALALVTCTVVVGFARVFDSWRFLGPLLAAALAGHLVAAVGRRRLPGLLAEPLMVVSAALVGAWVCLPHTLRAGLPTPTSWHRASTDLHSAWRGLGTELAPTHASPGFVLAAFLAVWCAAWMSDRLAFELHAPLESLVPATTVFLFVTLLSGPHHRLSSTMGFGVAVLLFVLVDRTDRANRARGTTSGIRSGSAATLRSGAMVSVAAVLAGALLVQVVPGARDPGAVSVRSLQRDRGPRTVVSPLVDIRRRLVDQSNAEVFTVRSPRPAYWRLMALDDFDGTVWSSNQDFGSVSGTLGGNPAAGYPTVRIRQTFNILGLDDPWAPVAFRAAELDGVRHLLWDGASSTLIADKTLGSISDLQYSVISEVPVVGSADVARARGVVPGAVRSRDTALPDLPTLVERTARQVVVDAGATTPYDQALALMRYFRNNFRYSLAVPPGQSGQAIEAFLLSRTGYCEQFAGTFAAMARTLGIPARVAVGFTPGEPDAVRSGIYHVFGRNAHAWPEVYLAGIGWLPFEPTPGRGDPNATSYTGVKPQQAAAGDPSRVKTAPTVPPSTTLPHPVTSLSPTPTTRPALAVPPPSSGGPAGRRGGWVDWVLGAAAAAGLALVSLGVVGGVREQRRRARRARAASPADQVLVAWAETQEAWAPAGFTPRPSETHRDYARRLDTHPATADLAALATAAAWAPDQVTPEQADHARRITEPLVARAHALLGRVRRLAYAVDPRPPERRLGRLDRR